MAGGLPCVGPTGQDRNIWVPVGKERPYDFGPAAALANEDEGNIGLKVTETRLDLVHRDALGTGDVPRGMLGE